MNDHCCFEGPGSAALDVLLPLSHGEKICDQEASHPQRLLPLVGFERPRVPHKNEVHVKIL